MRPELLRLILAQIFLHSTLAGNRMAAPLLALHLGYSAAAVGLLLALVGLSQLLLAVPIGRYIDRQGSRSVMLASVGAACLAGLMAAVWPVFAVLCLVALLTGGAAGATVIAVQRQVGRLSEDAAELRRSFSWLAIGPALSNVLGPLAVGFLIDHAGPSPASLPGFQAAFVFMALVPLVTWALLRRLREAAPEPDDGAAQGSVWHSWQLLRLPGIGRLMLVNWLVAASWDVHGLVIPLLGVERGLSASQIGMVLGSFALATGLVRVVLPMMVERLREWMVLVSAMLITAVMFGVYPFTQSAWTMALCSFLIGLALGTVQPMVMSLLHQITPSQRQGEVLGLRLMSVTASGVFVPLLLGSVSALIGLHGLFWLVAAWVGLGSRSALGLRRL
ncbi:MAG: MFS transporter [Betaproteobacteria bacterium]